MSSETYCPQPFTHMELYPDGRFRPCCKATMATEDRMENVAHKDYWNADVMMKIRRELLSGGRPTECRQCWQQEQVGGESLRKSSLNNPFVIESAQHSLVDKETGHSKSRPNHLMVTLSNQCNLQCRMCNGSFSSKWEEGFNQNKKLRDWMAGINIDWIKYGYNISDYQRDQKSQAFTANVVEFFEMGLADLRMLSILGGEPFTQNEHLEILKKCSGYEQNITLCYNSNLSVSSARLQTYMDHWEKFKAVHLVVSIDGPPALNEFIRVGTKQQVVEKNIVILKEWMKKHPDKMLLFSGSTFSAYNVKFIPETIKYTTRLGLKFIGNLTETPFFLRCQILPASEKAEITLKVNNFVANLEEELAEDFRVNQVWDAKSWRESHLENIRTFATSTMATMNGTDETKHAPYFEEFNRVFDECFVAPTK